MAFIGVISEYQDEKQLKKILNEKLNEEHKEHTIISINDKSIENIKNIRFETILVMDLKRVKTKENILNELFENAKYIVINADMEESLDMINNMKLNIITFGFNSKSTITASSVEEEILICLQRKIVNIEGKSLETQEIEAKVEDKKLLKNIHNLMGISSILLIYGKNEIFF